MARQRSKEPEVEDVTPRAEPLENERWEAFAHEFLRDLNCSKAAVRAKFSKNGAGQTGHRLLKNVEVRARIAYLQREQLRAVDMDAETWKRAILEIVGSDLRRLYDENGSLLPPAEWPDDIARVLDSVEVDAIYDGRGDDRALVGYTQKVKRTPRIKALELMARHLSLLMDNLNVTADDELVEALQRGRKRVGG